MNKTDLDAIPWTPQFSPKGKFGVFRKNLSEAAGGKKDAGTHAEGHPFDIELVRLPPEKINWPLHSHAAQWEAYIILSGHGRLRTQNEEHEIKAGDFLVLPPGEAHQMSNDSDEDLTYYVIADNPPADVIYYPDSQKYFIKPARKVFAIEADYFDGEE